MIIGNPGIGKSLFGLYLIQHFLHEKKPFIFEPYTPGSGSKIRLYFNGQYVSGTNNFNKDELSKKNFYNIIDGHEPSLENHPTNVILICSPRKDYYKNLLKYTYTIGPISILYMPVWSQQEIMESNEFFYNLPDDLVLSAIGIIFYFLIIN